LEYFGSKFIILKTTIV